MNLARVSAGSDSYDLSSSDAIGHLSYTPANRWANKRGQASRLPSPLLCHIQATSILTLFVGLRLPQRLQRIPVLIQDVPRPR